MLTQHPHTDHGKGLIPSNTKVHVGFTARRLLFAPSVAATSCSSIPKHTEFQGFLVVAIHVVIFKATPERSCCLIEGGLVSLI